MLLYCGDYIISEFAEQNPHIFFLSKWEDTIHGVNMPLNDNKPAAQAAGQTLLAEAPPIGKIYPFSKMTVTFEPLMEFWCPSGFRKFFITLTWFIS